MKKLFERIKSLECSELAKNFFRKMLEMSQGLTKEVAGATIVSVSLEFHDHARHLKPLLQKTDSGLNLYYGALTKSIGYIGLTRTPYGYSEELGRKIKEIHTVHLSAKEMFNNTFIVRP